MQRSSFFALAVAALVLTLLLASARGPAAGAQVEHQYNDRVTAQQTDGGDLDCADFSSREEAQAELESDLRDPNNLDADDDGQACEEFDYGGTASSGDRNNTTTDGSNEVTSSDSGSFRCESFLRVVRDDQGALRAQYLQYLNDDFIVQRFEQCLSGDVLLDTIPNKVLPNTGGPPVLLVPWLVGLAALGIRVLWRR
jgi:hypothetical protein